MSKKRNVFRELKPHKQKQQKQHFQQNRKPDNSIALESLVLSYLHTAATPLTLTKIVGDLAAGRHEPGDITTAVEALVHAGLVSSDGKKHFKLQKNGPLYEGTLVQHPKGFGFVTVTKGPKSPLTRDPFISSTQMRGAHHGDTVLIRVFRIRGDDRPEGGVIKILNPGPNRLGGIYLDNGRERLVQPDDRRFPFIIRLGDPSTLQPNHGDGVIVEFTRSADHPTKYLPGKIVEILGPAAAIDTQMRLVVEQFNLPFQFSDEILRETARLDETIIPDGRREDFRPIAHVTIDGENAKDFDDAICVAKTRSGYRLFVSIADVSHFVAPGSAIDREAYARGTSVYFPGRVIPMLPEKLSNDLCSLVPGQDRLTVSAVLDFDRQGRLMAKKFCRSIINSRQRFTYTTVQKILVDLDPAVRRQHKPFLTQLKWAGELATALQKSRRQRGAIDFNLSEPEFTLKDSGEIESIKRAERTFAHQLIEEFMLAANEAVAELFSRQAKPAIFRVHEAPEAIKVEEFAAFARKLGLSLSPFANDPAWFAEVLEKSAKTRYEYIINNLLLRSMKQAQYSAKNVGHFGLATSDYTHFTSPIRRYPDLIVHRELLRLLDPSPQPIPSRQPSLREAGEFLSARERTAVMAERDMNDRLNIGYMRQRIGDSFAAIISGVTDNAMYVELQDFCISGAIPVETLTDDYYLLDQKNYRLFGEITAKTYQIGDFIQVTVTDADLLSKKIRFKIASDAVH